MGVSSQLQGFGVGIISLLSLMQVPNEVVDQQNIKILANQLQKEPISNLFKPRQAWRVQDGFDIRSLARSSTMDGDQEHPQVWSQQGKKPVDQENSGDNGNKDQPEPDEDKDLFVDDVQGENAESILLFNGSGRTILVEGTFGHLGEHLGHGIRSIFMFKSSVVQNVSSIRCKFATEEKVNKVHLYDDIDEIEDFR